MANRTSRRAPTSSRGSSRSREAFEKLIAEVSARYITLLPGEVEPEIKRTLARIGRFMRSDRTFFIVPIEGGARHLVAHTWTQEEVAEDPVGTGFVIQEAFPWLGARMAAHEDVVVNNLDDLPAEAHPERAYCERAGIRSFLMCPLFSAEEVVAIIGVDAIRSSRTWTERDRRRVRLLGEVVANELLRQRSRELEHELEEVRVRQERLKAENRYLRREAEYGPGSSEIVAESAAMKGLLRKAQQVAATGSTVLLLGETGTGKEVLARTIHRLSPRAKHTLVAVNCAALSPTLIESELFGREKGAYTGAVRMQVGRFELAHRSTLLLDEVAELSLELQAKLLRVLQTGELERLGSPKTHRVDVRVIAATNRNLEQAVRDGGFREDLFYRLNVFPIAVPPLRERPEDVPLLVWALVQELEGSMGRRITEIPDGTMDALRAHRWPGNVRELRNVLERAMIVSSGGTLHVDLPQPAARPLLEASMTLAAAESAHIRAVLQETRGKIRGPGGAANLLGLKPSTLESRMKKLGIQRT